MHLDLATASPAHQKELVGRLKELGATLADVGQGDVPWTAMADPNTPDYRFSGTAPPVPNAAESPVQVSDGASLLLVSHRTTTSRRSRCSRLGRQ